MRFGSLFTGIGGIDLGLERAGMECAWQIEINPYCRQVLARHWPDVPRYTDIREVKGDELERVDLLCGGFPCQPVSLAGHRRGFSDPRWLWPEFARLLRLLRPRWVVAENVPGLLSADSGRLFGSVLRDLAESGYDAEWQMLPAAAFGAPHLRYRIFIVAYPSVLRTGRLPVRQGRSQQAQVELAGNSASLPNPDGQRCDGGLRIFPTAWPAGGYVAQRDHAWASEPGVRRVAYGVPHRVDRLRALGNAVVPQVAEWIGKRIMAAERRDGLDRTW